jgi:hypothetical protein
MRKYHVFLVFTIAVFLYLGLRLTPGLGWPVVLGLFYVFLGVLFYPLKWLRKSSMNRIQHLWRWKAYMDLGLLCFLLSLVVLRDLLHWPLKYVNPEWAVELMSPRSSAILILLSWLSLLFGVWGARAGPRL